MADEGPLARLGGILSGRSSRSASAPGSRLASPARNAEEPSRDRARAEADDETVRRVIAQVREQMLEERTNARRPSILRRREQEPEMERIPTVRRSGKRRRGRENRSRSRSRHSSRGSVTPFSGESGSEEDDIRVMVFKEVRNLLEDAGVPTSRKPRLECFPRFIPGNSYDLDTVTKYLKTLQQLPKLEKDNGLQNYLELLKGYIKDNALTWPEYRQILALKLPESLRLSILKMPQGEAMDYLAIYGKCGNIEDIRSDMRKLITHKFKSTTDIIEKTLPMVNKLDGSTATKLGYLYDIMRENVPRYLIDRLRAATSSRNESTAALMRFLNNFRGEIDAHLGSRRENRRETNTKAYNASVEKEIEASLCQMHSLQLEEDGHYNNMSTNVPQRPGQTRGGNVVCWGCEQAGHVRTNCPKKDFAPTTRDMKFCTKCKRLGHLEKECKARCRMCYAVSHASESCTKYQGIEPVAAACAKCIGNLNLTLYHPEAECKGMF